jgi:hypothetical protein
VILNKPLLKHFLALLVFALLNSTSNSVVHAEDQDSDSPKIVEFAGSIEIIFPNDERLLLTTGDEIPSFLPSGTLIKVLDGTVVLQAEEMLNRYITGQSVRITLSEGSWEMFSDPAKTGSGITPRDLSNSNEGEQAETEIQPLQEESNEPEETEIQVPQREVSVSPS